MKRFKNILLVLRESHNERGIERAVDLANKNGARLTLIKPPGQLTRSLEIFKGMESFGGLRAALLNKKRDDLEKLCDSLDAKDVIGSVASGGSPSVAIIRQVLRDNHDLVITTAQGTSSSMGGLFRSLSLHLIRKCPCPVWVVHPEKPRRVGQVLAAVDPGVTENGDAVNSMILDLATSLAQLDQAKLHIVHAHRALALEGFSKLLAKHGGTVPEDECRGRVEEAIAERRHRLDTLLQNHSLDSVEHEVHFVEGAPSHLIPKIADEQKVDVLVLGAVTHSRPLGHCIGTTAEDIIHQIGCSVLTVKPLNFVSPIELKD